jgi:hypothetical protein
MMTRKASWLAGALFLVLSGSALAHQSVRPHSYPADLNGSVTVYGGAYGPASWSGSLSFGSPYVYAPGYIPWAAIPSGHRHNARCNHGPRHVYNGPRHGYREAYRRGYDHGRYADDHRGGKHGHRGRGRGYDD